MTDRKCPTCGAPETSRSKNQGHVPNGKTRCTDYECGAGTDDGPGTPCPNAPKPEDVDVVVEIPAPGAVAADPTKAVVVPESIEQKVAAWSKTDAALTKAVKATEGLTIVGHVDGPKKGFAACDRARLDLKNARLPIERKRVELKGPVTALGKHIDNEAARLTAIVEPREKELAKLCDDYKEAEAKEAKRIADEAAEALRVAAAAELQRRIGVLVDLGAKPDLQVLAKATAEEFEAMVATAITAKDARDAADARRELGAARRKDAVAVRWYPDGAWLETATVDEWNEALERARTTMEEEDAAEATRKARRDLSDKRRALANPLEWAPESAWLETASDEDFDQGLAAAQARKTKRDNDAAELETLRKNKAAEPKPEPVPEPVAAPDRSRGGLVSGVLVVGGSLGTPTLTAKGRELLAERGFAPDAAPIYDNAQDLAPNAPAILAPADEEFPDYSEPAPVAPVGDEVFESGKMDRSVVAIWCDSIEGLLITCPVVENIEVDRLVQSKVGEMLASLRELRFGVQE